MSSRLIAFFLFTSLVIWLAFSESPSDRRLEQINTLISEQKIADTDVKTTQKLQQLLKWLTDSALIKTNISVNQQIDRNRLDLVITKPEYSHLTYTSNGNAIYDPDFDVIFIDEYLVKPLDILSIGEPGSYTMTTSELDELEFVDNYLTFIIAHELGHRINNDRASAFFSLDWLALNQSSVADELAADTYAVSLIHSAHSETIPDFIEDNTLQFSGLMSVGDDERAAGQLFSGFLGMSLLMQFGGSPYSPFFHDKAHPSFLSRSMKAIEKALPDASSLIKDQAPLIAEQVRRTSALCHWDAQSLHFPTPVARVEWRDGRLWIGTVESPFNKQPGDTLREYLFEIVDPDSDDAFRLVKEGTSPLDDSLPGDWLDDLFLTGLPAHGLASYEAAYQAIDSFDNKTFETFARLEFDHDDEIWSWNMPMSGAQTISNSVLKEFSSKTYQLDVHSIGRPSWSEGLLIFPILLSQDNSQILRLVSLEAETGILEGNEFRFETNDGYIELETVTPLANGWFVLTHDSSMDEGSFNHFFWLDSQGKPTLIDTKPTLFQFIGPNGEHAYGRDLNPYLFFTKTIADDAILMWNDTESAWHITKTDVNVAFNPSNDAIVATSLDKKHVLWWIRNAQKAYLVDYSKFSNRECDSKES